MSDQTLKYYQQRDFRGGICTEEANLRSNQLLDARNVWAPYSILLRRPGYQKCQPAISPLSTNITDQYGEAIIPAFKTVTAAWRMTSAGVYSTITPSGGSFDVSSFPVGDAFVLSFTTSGTGDMTGLFALRIDIIQANSNSTFFAVEVYTERGWVVCHHQSDGYYLLENGAATPTGGGPFSQQIRLAVPNDVVTDLSTIPDLGASGTGIAARFRILNAALDASSKIVVASTYAISNNGLTNNHAQALWRINNNSLLQVYTTDQSTSINGGITAYVPAFATYAMGSRPQQFPAEMIPFYTNVINDQFAHRFVPKVCAIPPSIVTIGSGNGALTFCAYQQLITAHYLGVAAGASTPNPYYNVSNSSNGGPLNGASAFLYPYVPQVDTSSPEVTPTSSGGVGNYPSDVYAQYATFPAANLILYYADLLFAADIAGDQNAIYYSGNVSLGAWNIWPTANRLILATSNDFATSEENRVRALAGLHDNAVAYKKTSIWSLIPAAPSTDLGLPVFEPRRVVAGVGTEAPSSIVNIPQGQIFLAADGFYIFDGTPNIKRVSNPIQSYIDRITPLGHILARGVHWRTKHCYLCAVQLPGADNIQDLNYIFVYDYEQDAWWVWDGWNVRCWFLDNVSGQQERLYFINDLGEMCQVMPDHADDAGVSAENYILTQRFGKDEIDSKAAREFRVMGVNNNPSMTAELIYDDIRDFVTRSINMPKESDTQYSEVTYAAEPSYTPNRYSERKVPSPFVTAKWHQVRLSNFNELHNVSLGYIERGNR